MKYLLLLLLLPLNALSQKSLSTLSFVYDFPEKPAWGWGFQATSSGRLFEGFYLGVSAGVTKIEGMKSYIPIAGSITFKAKAPGNAIPFMVVQPGYGLYNSNGVEGGFTFHAAGGIISKGKPSSFATLGYTHYGFDGAGIKTNTEGATLRIGIMF